MDLQHSLSSTAIFSIQHLEIYEGNIVDTKGVGNHGNKMQR